MMILEDSAKVTVEVKATVAPKINIDVPKGVDPPKTLRILVLGMFATSHGELSYEGRIIHKLAEQPGVQVDYITDTPLTYDKEPVLKKPLFLNSWMYEKGDQALARTPRQFHPKDVKRIIGRHLDEPNMVSIVAPYDVIFATAQTGIDMGVWLKQVLDIPLVVQILDIPLWRLTQFGPHQIYREATMPLPLLPTQMFENYVNEWTFWFGNFALVDRVTTIMDCVKEDMLKVVRGYPAEKISVVKHGSIDVDTFNYYREKEQVEKKDQVIVLNRHDFHKGVDQSIAICARIKELRPTTKFVFVSEGQEWYSTLLKEYAKSLLGDSVEFTGWVDNPTKVKLLRESKVLLDQEWPSGFGGCCLAEAIFADCIPICWDTPGKKEVTNNMYAEIIPKNDITAAANRASSILNGKFNWSPELFTEAREWITANRSVEAHAKGLLQVFMDVVK